MESNFSFLEKDFPVLYKYGCFAEQYLYSDPNTCLFKMGQMGELIINLMFDFDNIQPVPRESIDKIKTLGRIGLLDYDMESLFHSLRKIRNIAVHEGDGDTVTCKRYLPVIHSLSSWFEEVYGSLDFDASQVSFVMPAEKTEIDAEPIKLEAKEEERLLADAEKAAKKKKAVARNTRQQQTAAAANKRNKSEAETRILIDEQLRQVGWEADTTNIRYSNGTRPKKGHNMAIAEWPTNSNHGNGGYADYALFTGQQMVGIIEAKAAHKDVSTVIDFQGKDYPKHIRPEDDKYVIGTWGEYKVPFTFATNGRPYLEPVSYTHLRAHET